MAYKPEARPMFVLGDSVRVKDGVQDPDYEGLCIGGWTGTIEEIDTDQDPPFLLIAWDPRTLDELVGEAFLARAAQYGLDGSSIWLEATEVERLDLAQGTQPPQPADIEVPLREDFEEEDIEAELRLAEIFGLDEHGALPMVSENALLIYHQYLQEHLQFPFAVEYCEESEEPEEVYKLIEVANLAGQDEIDLEDGILCHGKFEQWDVMVPLADVVVDDDESNFQIIDDYQYWFFSYS